MSRDATAITTARETTCPRMTLDLGTTGRLVRHRGVEIGARFQYGRVQSHAKKEAAILATTRLRAISTMIAAVEDRKSDTNEHHVKATAVTSAKPHVISRSPGGSRLLDAA